MTTVKQRLAEKRAKLKRAVRSKVAESYSPEMPVPEEELRAIGATIVKMGLSDKPINLTILKTLIMKLRASLKKAKLSSKIDEREFEAVVESQMWLLGMSVEVQKQYEDMGYRKIKTAYGNEFRKKV